MSLTNRKIYTIIFSLVSVMLLFLIPTTATAVEGNNNTSAGNQKNNGIWKSTVGESWDGSGTTDAWKSFVGKIKYSSAQATNMINDTAGSKRFTSGNLKLATACKRSQIIAYFTDDSGKEFYTKSGINNETKRWRGTISEATLDYIADWFKRNESQFYTGHGVTIICSYIDETSSSSTIPGLEKREVVLKAKSGTFKYDKTYHTVSGFTVSGDKLFKGDSISALSSERRKAAGTYEVDFEYAKILDSNGKNVTKYKYKLTTVNGELKITRAPVVSEYERCLYTGRDSVTAITKNEIKVNPFSIPETASDYLDELIGKEYTDANKQMKEAALPDDGDSRATWNAWKSNIDTDDMFIEIDLEDITQEGDSFSTVFSQYGGVLDILTIHHKKKVESEFCQPQVNVKTTTWKDDGSGGAAEEVITWSGWKDEGPEKIDSMSSTTAIAPKRTAYQVLSVNCVELDDYNSIINFLDGKGVLSKRAINAGSNTALIQTTKKDVTGSDESTHFIIGRSSSNVSMNKASKTKFYTESTGCENNKLCTVDKFAGNDDAKNNRTKVNPSTGKVENVEPLFSHYNKDEYKDGYGDTSPITNSNNLSPSTAVKQNLEGITFFRDNQDRTVRADVWYMREIGNPNEGFITSSSKSAEMTYLKLFEGGTPDISITTIQPLNNKVRKDTGFSAEGNEAQAEIQKGEEKLTDKLSYYGSINRFNFKSQWASNENKPHLLGINWVYEIDMERKEITSASNTSTKYEDRIQKAIQVSCEFSNVYSGSKNAQINYNPFANPVIDEDELNFDSKNAVKVQFSRGVSETRDEE